ncbi:MAG: TPM domain-containing protein [Lachnospiraceae bacterium]|nr:TPM domain-containing protein [Lachnospiraceae bacterium]
MRKMKTIRLSAFLAAFFITLTALSSPAFAGAEIIDLESVQSAVLQEVGEIEEGTLAAAEESADGMEGAAAETDGSYDYEDEGGSGPYTNNRGIVFYMPYIEDTSERVFDYAELLDDSAEESLRSRIAELEDKKDCVIVILTSSRVPRDAYYGNKTSMLYAEQFFMDLTGYSQETDVDGFLFLLDMNNRIIYTVGAGRFKGEKYVDFEEEVYNAAVPGMRSGDYPQVCEQFLDAVDRLENVAYAAIPTFTSLIVSAVLTLIVLLVLLSKHNSSQPVNNAKIAVKTMNYRGLGHHAVFLGKRTNQRRIERSGSSGGGGGFSGGSHSGGGFSGGGGGFSGGGGHF